MTNICMLYEANTAVCFICQGKGLQHYFYVPLTLNNFIEISFAEIL